MCTDGCRASSDTHTHTLTRESQCQQFLCVCVCVRYCLCHRRIPLGGTPHWVQNDRTTLWKRYNHIGIEIECSAQFADVDLCVETFCHWAISGPTIPAMRCHASDVDAHRGWGCVCVCGFNKFEHKHSNAKHTHTHMHIVADIRTESSCVCVCV